MRALDVVGVLVGVVCMSRKLTVLRGVVRVMAWLRLRAVRVMSCNCLSERERQARDEAWLELRGVKKRVKRLGVMGGGRLCLRVAVGAGAGAGGDDEKSSGVGSWKATRGAHGDDMVELGPSRRCTCIYNKETTKDKGQFGCWTQTRNTESPTRDGDMGWNAGADVKM